MPTTTHARLLLASRNTQTGDILYTWELTFPRPILAEVNTHRKASRNTSSSRAISIKKLRAAIRFDPFIPISFGKNQKGMQAGAELTGWRRQLAELTVRAFRYPALLQSVILEALGVHKQVSNRYLEPWMWCKQVFSATDVNNLLRLRNHPDAEPHFHELAKQMQAQVEWVREQSQTTGLTSNVELDVVEFQYVRPGQWHLPYIKREEQFLPHNDLITLSMARCANTSYTMPGEGGLTDIRQARLIANKLFGGDIKHLSPTEHQAQAMMLPLYAANFCGWRQYRKTLPNESGE